MGMIHVRHSAGNTNPGHNHKFSNLQFPTVESISHPFGASSPFGKRVAQPAHQSPLAQHPSTPSIAPWEIAEQAGSSLESAGAPGVVSMPGHTGVAATNPFIAPLAE